MSFAGRGPHFLAVFLPVLLLIAAAVFFLVPASDCPVCTAKDPAGHSTLTYHDIVALRGASCCDGRGKVTPFRKWRLDRMLDPAATGRASGR